ncbi:hypothetical protein BDC45DRAFT_418242, partial [Circinella umbellata]
QRKNNNSSNNFGMKKDKDTRKCYYCGKEGHIARVCFKRLKKEPTRQTQRQNAAADEEEDTDIFGHLFQGNQGVVKSPLRFHSKIILSTGQQQTALMDTGSTLTSIRADVAQLLDL